MHLALECSWHTHEYISTMHLVLTQCTWHIGTMHLTHGTMHFRNAPQCTWHRGLGTTDLTQSIRRAMHLARGCLSPPTRVSGGAERMLTNCPGHAGLSAVPKTGFRFQVRVVLDVSFARAGSVSGRGPGKASWKRKPEALRVTKMRTPYVEPAVHAVVMASKRRRAPTRLNRKVQRVFPS